VISFHRSTLALLAGLLVLGPARAADTFAELLKQVPPQANAVLFLDVKAAYESPLAVREKWGQQQDTQYLGGVSRFPRAANKLVAASQLSPGNLENAWEVSLLQVPKEVTASQIARAEAGSLDSLASMDVVLLPRNGYAAILEPGTVGVQRPANRQEMARWLRLVRSPSRAPVSPYLERAAALAGRQTPAVLAIDLTDVFDPDGVRRRLAANPLLREQKADLDRLTRLIAGMRGLTLLIRIEDALSGELRLDFAESPMALAGLAVPLIGRALDSMGAHIENLRNWKSEVRDNAIVLRGPLSRPEVRLLLSPLLHPATAVQTQPPAAGPPPAGAPAQYDPRLVASLRYFHSVKKLLDDLYNYKAKSFAALSTWHNKTAKAIDELPVLNVDEELLKYGRAVSVTLRQMATFTRGVGDRNAIVESQTQEVLATVPTATFYGPWGGGWTYGNLTNVNNYGAVYGMMATNKAAEGQVRSQTWTNINEATAQVRQKMSQKYNVEFH
jgi:hypothetical protein